MSERPETPDRCELVASDRARCEMDVLSTCTGCGRAYCWSHTRNDREYRCSECTDALADRATANGLALVAALRAAGVEPPLTGGAARRRTWLPGRARAARSGLWATGISADSYPWDAVLLRADGRWAGTDGQPVGILLTESMARRAADLTAETIIGLNRH